jgi:SAM-dependent methyltransferase
MPSDPREIVARGYDAAAVEYGQWAARNVIDPARTIYQERFCGLLLQNSAVLELGCGGGGPTTERLAQRFALTGIDISSTQVRLARERVSLATFRQADMTHATFAPSSFDGIAAFYSLIHLPYGELPAMLVRVAAWLRPGGVFVASLSGRDESGEHFADDWLAGSPMYWSGYGLAETRRFIEEAGLTILEANVETNIEDGQPAPFLWVIASKSAGAN